MKCSIISIEEATKAALSKIEYLQKRLREVKSDLVDCNNLKAKLERDQARMETDLSDLRYAMRGERPPARIAAAPQIVTGTMRPCWFRD